MSPRRSVPAFNSVKRWPRRKIPAAHQQMIAKLVGTVLTDRPRPPLPLCREDTYYECLAAAELAYHKWDYRRASLRTYLINRISCHLTDLYRKFGKVTRGGNSRGQKVEYLTTHERGTHITPCRVAAAREVLDRIFALRPNGTKARQIIFEFVRCLDVKKTAAASRSTITAVHSVLSQWRKNYVTAMDDGITEVLRKRRSRSRRLPIRRTRA